MLISGEAGALRISLHWCKAVEGPDTAGTSGRTSENLSLPPTGWCEQVGGGIQTTINKNRDLEVLTFHKITPPIAEQTKSPKKRGKHFLITTVVSCPEDAADSSERLARRDPSSFCPRSWAQGPCSFSAPPPGWYPGLAPKRRKAMQCSLSFMVLRGCESCVCIFSNTQESAG